jgi:hypothetical protein
MGIVGEVTLQCFGAEGNLKWEDTHHNLITTVGDQYYAKMGCAGVSGNSAPTNLANGMKLGTNVVSGAVAKSSTGSFIATGNYISGSNNTFDSVVATVVSGDTGWKITYITTWPPGDATNSSIQEIAIVTDQATDNTSTNGATACISRALISPARNKQSGDTLIATYTHTFLGAP